MFETDCEKGFFASARNDLLSELQPVPLPDPPEIKLMTEEMTPMTAVEGTEPKQNGDGNY